MCVAVYPVALCRQISGNNRAPLPGMEGLSPIADVERESEASFSTQHGELLEFPDLDVSYGSSSGTPRGPRVGGGQGSIHSPVLESEPLAYLRCVCVLCIVCVCVSCVLCCAAVMWW